MKLTVLNDNEAGNNCEAEHGLSYLIEDDIKILFDAGPSKVFLRNAKKLKIDLENINLVVLSHGHWDHGNGLEYIKNKKLICHPGCFIKRFRIKDKSRIGLPFNLEKAKKQFDLYTTKDPYIISDNIIFLGEIPRTNDFEAQKSYFVKEDDTEDFVLDDSGIAIKSKKGLIIISGCSHAGICNTIEYGKKITGVKKVYSVIGGFHMKEVDEVTKKTIDFLKKEQVEKLYPSHCVSLAVLNEFSKELKITRLHSGDIIEL